MSGEDFPLCAQSAAFDADFARGIREVVKKYGIMCGTSWEETKMAERLLKAKKAKNAAANAAVETES